MVARRGFHVLVKMEFQNGDCDRNISFPRHRQEGNYVSSNTLIISLIFLAVLQVYKRKCLKEKEKSLKFANCVGMEALPKAKNVVPLKLIGILPKMLPVEKLLQVGIEMNQEMGGLWRCEALGFNFVVFNSGPALQTFLKSGDFGHLHKAPVAYAPMKPFISTGTLVSDGPFWQKQRKLLMKSQSFKNLKAYIEMLNRHSQNFVEKMEKKFQDEKRHEICDEINTSFLEIITELITGDCLDQSEEIHQYHKHFTYWKDSIAVRVLNPLLMLEPLWMLHPRYRKHMRAVKELSDFAKRRIKEKKEARAAAANGFTTSDRNQNEPSFRSVIDELLDAELEESQVVEEINVMMFGGHETGATAIHCLLFALALHPELQEKARQEVDELFADPFYVKDDGRIPFEVAQGGLKYVEQCILEGLRLFPPVFCVFRQLLTELPIEFEGKTVVIPRGTATILCPFTVHRQKELYPDPFKYDPDRFLPEEVEKRHAYTYIPFLAGPRNCLGLKFAMIELKIITAHILRNFEITTTDKMEDVTWLPYTTLTPAKNFSFQFKKRNVV